MTYKQLNVNSTVKVRLTNYGKAVLEEQHNELWSSLGVRNQFPYIPKKEDENGFVEFQLWELMGKLGKECDLGGELAFETTILIDENDLRYVK